MVGVSLHLPAGTGFACGPFVAIQQGCNFLPESLPRLAQFNTSGASLFAYASSFNSDERFDFRYFCYHSPASTIGATTQSMGL